MPLSNIVYLGLAGGLSGARVSMLLVVAALGVAWLQWWRHQVAVEGGVLRIDKGVIVRKQQLLPCDRIQEISLVQPVRDRLFGLATLRIQSASGDGTVTLASLSWADAEELRLGLLALRGGSTRPVGAGGVIADPLVAAEGEWIPAAHHLTSVSYPRLALHGVTGGSVLVVLTAMASLVELLDPGGGGGDSDVAAAAVVLGVALIGAVVLTGSVVASVLQYGGFTLDLLGDEIHARYGLLDRRHLVIPLERIQAVEVTAPLPRRLLGFASVSFRSAGRGSLADHRLTVPIVSEDDLVGLLTTVLRRSAVLPPLSAAPPVARRRAVVRHTAPVMIPAVVAAGALWPVGLIAGAGVLAAWGAGRAAYRGLGHAMTDEVVVARRGWLMRRTAVVPVTRPQSVAVRSSPFQRRLGLATTVVHLAGRGNDPRVIDQDEAVAHDLRAQLTRRGATARHR